MRKLLLTLFLCLTGLAEVSTGCSLIGGPGLSQFDTNEYVFIGKVRDYTEPIESKEFRGTAYGLIVDVKESVYLPKTPKRNVEVYPIQLWADCSLGGTSLAELKKYYPPGSEVRVIATEAKLLPKAGSYEIIRLETLPEAPSSITLNTDETGRSLTTATSIYNYKSYDYEKDSGVPAKYNLPSFEVRKDILRLKNSGNQAERNGILERFMSVARIDDLDFYGVLKAYAVSELEADRYYESNLKAFDPDFYSQYMSVKNARIELIKMGYKKEDVENAMGKGMNAGAGFTAEEIIKGALKYLPKKN